MDASKTGFTTYQQDFVDNHDDSQEEDDGAQDREEEKQQLLLNAFNNSEDMVQSTFMTQSFYPTNGNFQENEDEDEEETEDEQERQKEKEDLYKGAFDDLSDSDSDDSNFLSRTSGDVSRHSVQDTGRNFDDHGQQIYGMNMQYSYIPGHYEGVQQPLSSPNQKHLENEQVSFANSECSNSFITSQSEQLPSAGRPDLRLNLDGINSHPGGDGSGKGVLAQHKDDNSDLDSNVQNTKESLSSLQYNFMHSDNPQDQLKLLYQARGKELNQLTAQLEKLRVEKVTESKKLQHQITLLRAENESLTEGRSQVQILLVEKDKQIESLKADIQESITKEKEAAIELKKMQVRVETAESLVKTLEQNVTELRSVDSLAKSRKMHEDFLGKLQQSHQEEIKSLKSKLSVSQQKEKELQNAMRELQQTLNSSSKNYECLLREKSKMVDELKTSLEVRQQQCDALLAAKVAGTMNENINQISSENEKLKEKLKSLEEKVAMQKDNLEFYDNALKLQVFTNVDVDESMAQLKIKGQKHLTFDDTSLQSEKNQTVDGSPSKETVAKLKDQLQLVLLNLKKNRDVQSKADDEIKRLTQENRRANAHLKSAKVDLEELKATVKDLEEQNNKTMSAKGTNDAKWMNVAQENSLLKEEMVLLLQHFEALRNVEMKVNSLLKMMQENFESHLNESFVQKIYSGLEKCLSDIDRVKGFHTFIGELKNKNLELHGDKLVWVDKIGSIISMLSKLYGRVISGTFSNENGFSNCSTELKKVLEEFKSYALIMKNEFRVYENNIELNNELISYKLSCEKMKKNLFEKEAQFQKISDELNSLRNLHERKVADAVESRKETFLQFHDEAVKVVQQDFLKIKSKLEDTIEDLRKELDEVKQSYLNVCKEKSDLSKMAEASKSSCNRESAVSEEQLKIVLASLTQRYESKLASLRSEHETELRNANQKPSDCVDSGVQTEQLLLASKTKENIPTESIDCDSYIHDAIKSALLRIKNIFDTVSFEDNNPVNNTDECDVLKNKLKPVEDLLSSLDSRLKVAEKINPSSTTEEYDVDCFNLSTLNSYRNLFMKLSQQKLKIENELRAAEKKCESLQMSIDNQKESQIKEIYELQEAFRSRLQRIEAEHEEVVCKLQDIIENKESDLSNAIHQNAKEKIDFDKHLTNLTSEKKDLEKSLFALKIDLEKERAEAMEKREELKQKYSKLREKTLNRSEAWKKRVEEICKKYDKDRLELVKKFSDWLFGIRGTLLKELKALKTIVEGINTEKISNCNSVELRKAKCLEVLQCMDKTLAALVVLSDGFAKSEEKKVE